MKLTKKTVCLLICCAAVILLSIPALGADCTVFLKWWLGVLVLGIGFYPLTKTLFSKFSDRGWMFSKAIGIGLSGYAVFTLVSVKLTVFNSIFSILCTAALMALCWILYFVKDKKKTAPEPTEVPIDPDLILTEELLFLSLFLLWTYFAGCRPEAYGTEKFMDYGFMAAMMRDGALPARDMWFSTGTINYYYGGQFYAVFLTRLTGTRIQETYNVMRTLVAAFAFVLPFSVVWQLMKNRRASAGKALPYAAGAFAGAAVSLAGNMHYVLYGLFGKVFQLSGYDTYWFPSSTRYIGHNPLTDYDQCIHEFPSYSFVLGDLHAHVVNVLFVLCFAGILYAWFLKQEEEGEEAAGGLRAVFLSVVRDPHILLLGVLTGIFMFTNFWDAAIYFVVGFIGFALVSLRKKKDAGLRFVFRTACTAVIGMVVSIPFRMHFKTMMQGFGLSPYHTPFYQMAILWGLPVLSVLMLLVYTILKNRRIVSETGKHGYLSNLNLSDLTALLMGICAIGLILVPEVMYVRDIYEDNYARCNTMFKFTYQAFILFGMSFVYALFRLLADVKKLAVRFVSGFLIFLFVLTCGYFPYAVNCWFGNVFSPDAYRNLDATAFLETVYPGDVQAIHWLMENVEGNPVVLEADGNSYSDWERVSAMTGLPTVMGWFVHEWLWRSDTQELIYKSQDVRDIYTLTDIDEVKKLLREYEVAYIFIGSCERESYPEMNEELLQSLGTVVFRGDAGETPAYIIQIDQTG